MEEIGQEVIVGELVYVREYIGKNHEFSAWDSGFHQVEFYFMCSLASNAPLFGDGTNPDQDQVGVEWIELQQLDEIRLYPRALGKSIKRNELELRYFGDVN